MSKNYLGKQLIAILGVLISNVSTSEALPPVLLAAVPSSPTCFDAVQQQGSVLDLNNHRQMAATRNGRAVRIHGDIVTQVGPPNSTQSAGYAINDSGSVAGTDGNYSSNQAFINVNGTIHTVAAGGVLSFGFIPEINNLGFAVSTIRNAHGFYQTSQQVVVLAPQANGSYQLVNLTPGNANGSIPYSAQGINNGGTVIASDGMFGLKTNSAGQLQRLAFPAAPSGMYVSNTFAMGINNRGTVAGGARYLNSTTSSNSSNLWRGTDIINIPVPALPNAVGGLAMDINNLDQVVGQFGVRNGTTVNSVAYFYQNGVTRDLNSMLCSPIRADLTLSYGWHINDHSEITASSRSSGNQNAPYFLLIPRAVPLSSKAVCADDGC